LGNVSLSVPSFTIGNPIGIGCRAICRILGNSTFNIYNVGLPVLSDIYTCSYFKKLPIPNRPAFKGSYKRKASRNICESNLVQVCLVFW
jgi:hypothetical protein